MEKHWYDSRTLIIVLFFIFPPIGIYGMAKRNTVLWNKLLYIVPSALIVFFFTLGFFAVVLSDNYKAGLDHYNKQEYIDAYENFDKVPQDDKHYKDALAKMLEIKPMVDRLRKMEILQKEATSNEPKKPDSMALAESAGQKIAKHLKKEIASIDDGVDFSIYRNSVESIQMEIVLFSAWAKAVDEGLAADSATMKIAKELEQKVAKIQLKEFPKLRAAYKKVIHQKLWEENVETGIFGGRNTTIQFTGGIFASNKNKQQMQETLNEILSMLRFKRVNYKWYEYDEVTYYDLDTPADSDPVKL